MNESHPRPSRGSGCPRPSKDVPSKPPATQPGRERGGPGAVAPEDRQLEQSLAWQLKATANQLGTRQDDRPPQSQQDQEMLTQAFETNFTAAVRPEIMNAQRSKGLRLTARERPTRWKRASP